MFKFYDFLFLVLLTWITAGASADPLDLTVSEGFKNPIGFYDDTPTFSWKLPKEVKAQQGYRIVVASDPALLPDKADLWDSRKVDSDQSTFVPYKGKALGSRQKAYWQVMSWPDTDWSEVAHFELGLLNNSDWQAQWIQLAEPHILGDR